MKPLIADLHMHSVMSGHAFGTIREGLKRTGGYCPCRLERTPENKCVCKEFRDQIADPKFHGYCHCMLYYKE